MRKVIHRIIVKYLVKCGGSLHTLPYGVNGKYVMLVTEKEYHKSRKHLFT